MIPFMHADLAAEHVAAVLEQARRDSLARQARRVRRHRTEAAPNPGAIVHHPFALRPWRATAGHDHPAGGCEDCKEVA